jgi:serine/threonine-protein kinase RsbW
MRVNDAGELPQTMAWLEQRLESLGLQGRAAYGLTVSVDEALTNVMTHGLDALPASQRRAEVRCAQRNDGRVVVQIRDNGAPFDPTQHAPVELSVDIDEAGIGGHGVRLMKHFVSELTYERQDGWNVLTLVSGE